MCFVPMNWNDGSLIICKIRLLTRALGLRAELGQARAQLVYKIPYRRARAWPSGKVRARAKVSCIQARNDSVSYIQALYLYGVLHILRNQQRGMGFPNGYG